MHITLYKRVCPDVPTTRTILYDIYFFGRILFSLTYRRLTIASIAQAFNKRVWSKYRLVWAVYTFIMYLHVFVRYFFNYTRWSDVTNKQPLRKTTYIVPSSVFLFLIFVWSILYKFILFQGYIKSNPNVKCTRIKWTNPAVLVPVYSSNFLVII